MSSVGRGRAVKLGFRAPRTAAVGESARADLAYRDLPAALPARAPVPAVRTRRETALCLAAWAKCLVRSVEEVKNTRVAKRRPDRGFVVLGCWGSFARVSPRVRRLLGAPCGAGIAVLSGSRWHSHKSFGAATALRGWTQLAGVLSRCSRSSSVCLLHETKSVAWHLASFWKPQFSVCILLNCNIISPVIAI